MATEEEQHEFVEMLVRVRRALEATVVESDVREHRQAGLAYMVVAEAVLMTVHRHIPRSDYRHSAATWREIGHSVGSAHAQSDWPAVLQTSYGALQSLPGETGWIPGHLPPPPL
jgi:hypothetical protein